MILSFPNRAALHLALGNGLITAEIAQSPCTACESAEGMICVEFAGRSNKKQRDDFAAFGIAVTTEPLTGEIRKHSHWLELLPLKSLPLKLTSQTAVIFLLESCDLPSLVIEMLRLGNDRQSIATLGDGRVLLRVIAPPYYTLLRAIDPAPDSKSLLAFLEAAPRVWIEAGFAHPFAAKIEVEENAVMLISAKQWQTLKSPVFQDVYESLHFTVAIPDFLVVAATPLEPISVSLSLVPGDASAQPSLWVIADDAEKRIQHFVEESDSRLIAQLVFAVAIDGKGHRTIILKSRSSQSPILQLERAAGYVPFWRLPNLFLPLGKRLHPPIRRDIVAKLLADDPDQLVWLEDHGTEFAPRSVAENAFRPLADWVEYVIDANREALTSWMASSTFDFESFVAVDTPAAPLEREKKPPLRSPKPLAAPEVKAIAEVPVVASISALPIESVEAKSQGEWQVRCDQLEKQFLAVDGPLDAPARQALWPELAKANTELGPDRRHEAALCNLNAAWLDSTWRPSKPLSIFEFNAILNRTEPTPTELLTFATAILSAEEVPCDLLPVMQRFTETHDQLLPIRAAWLLGLRFAELSGGDKLGLARTRDRLLLRLLDRGLVPELDLPAFLRFAGTKNSEQARLVRDRMAEVHATVRNWTLSSLQSPIQGPMKHDPNATLAYLDLMFAWGLASLGELTVSQGLVEAARRVLDKSDKADDKSLTGTFLFRGYKFRIDEAMAGRQPSGPLPAELSQLLDDYHAKKRGVSNSPYGLAEYAIARLREQSAILDPLEKLDPYAETQKDTDDLTRIIAELPRMREPGTLMRTIRGLFRDGVKTRPLPETRLFLLHEALPLAPRAGQDFTLELLCHVSVTIRATFSASLGLSAVRQVRLIARAIPLAAMYNRADLVPEYLDLFFRVLAERSLEHRFELINLGVGPCFRSLKKMGLRDALDQFFRRLQAEGLDGESIVQHRDAFSNQPDLRAEAVRSHLNLAAGWLSFDAFDNAEPILDAAREELLAANAAMTPKSVAELAQTYLMALGFGPAQRAIERILDLFRRLDPSRIRHTFTTAPYYSRFHLNLVEEAVLALASDDSRAGSECRRWLEEDELLVRRRIHADVRRLVES